MASSEDSFAQHDEIERLVSRLGDVPTLPDIASRLLHTLDDPQTTATDIGRMVTSDQALATKLLRTANSAYVGLGRRVGSVTEAIILLGFQSVRSMVLGISVIDSFLRPVGMETLDYEQLWKHSVTVGAATQQISRRTTGTGSEIAFLAGLLHDLGKIIIARVKPSDYDTTLKLAHQEALSMSEAEIITFGFDHCEVAGWAMTEWRFPPEVTAACRYHHRITPEVAQLPHWPMVAAVHAANCLDRRPTSGAKGDGSLASIHPAAQELLGLTIEDYTGVITRALAEAATRWRDLTNR